MMKKPKTVAETLTWREQEILALLRERLSNHEIAIKLSLSVHSVKWHTRQIYNKLGVNNRREAVAWFEAVEQAAAPAPSRPPEHAVQRSGRREPAGSTHNLPAPLTSFIGRDDVVAEVAALLETHRLVTLTGSGGVGKTRLALRVAETVLARYPDGVWLVELAAQEDEKRVLQAVAALFGFQESVRRSLFSALEAYLSTRNLLIILDNCEHLIEACARMSEQLLRACQNLHILATSREVLGINGEQVYSVPSMSFPGTNDLPALDNLLQYEAIRLFVERTQAAQPAFQMTSENASSIARICQRLDGIPLAIELASARALLLSVEQIQQRLESDFQLLTGSLRTALTRHQTVRASIEWSYRLLSSEEQALLRQLSVFAGGWTLEAAAAMCADEEAILEGMSQLVNKSLVIAVPRPGKGAGRKTVVRYHLLEMVRQYAGQQLAVSGELARSQDCHLAYFVGLAGQVEPALHTAQRLVGLARLHDELENFRAALAWSLKSGDVEAGLRLTGALRDLWGMSGLSREGQEWTDQFLNLAPVDDSRLFSLRAKCLSVAGWLRFDLGLWAEAYRCFEESAALSRMTGDLALLALAVDMQGFSLSWLEGETSRVIALFDESIETARASGDQWVLAKCIVFGRGGQFLALGDMESGRLYAEESMALFEQVGDRWAMWDPISCFGLICCHHGDYATAQRHFETSLALSQEEGNQVLMHWALDQLGNLAYLLGRYQEMEDYTLESHAVSQKIGFLEGAAWSLRRSATAARLQGAYLRAAGRFRESLDLVVNLYQTKTHGEEIQFCMEGIARLAIDQGQPVRAAQLLGAAEGLFGVVEYTVYNPIEAGEHYQARAKAAALLGEAAFQAAFEEGRSLLLEAAIREAKELSESASG